jgi:hypothetical protein
MPVKESDLEPVTDLKMVQRYLKYGLEFHEAVSCILDDGGLRFEAQLFSVEDSTLTLELEIDQEPFAKLDSNQLGVVDQPQAGVRISYSVNEATFFVHGKIQRRTGKRISIKADMPMYKLQRRESLRIKVMESHKASVKLGSTTLPLFDISAGGISVVIPFDQEKTYKQKQAFPASVLYFVGKEFKVDLEVKNVLGHSKDGQKIKVGFKFKALPASIEQLIAREAYLHTAKIWSRWL